MDVALIVGIVAIGLIAGFFLIGVVLHKKQLTAAFEGAQAEAKKMREDARKEADQLVKQAIREAKDDNRKRRHQFEDETKTRRSEINKLESKIKNREHTLEKKLAIIEKREIELEGLDSKLKQEDQRYLRLIGECETTLDHNRKTLQSIANMSAEEAKRELIKSLEADARREAADTLKRIEEETTREAEHKARAVVSLAVQRVSSEYVSDSTISVVALPSEDMKGRIIGREGRNIRAIEQATGVDLIIDDTPEAVIISCFNSIRREIAKLALERLIADGRIHPARIEETCKRVEGEFDQIVQDNGEQAAFDTGITDLHPELVKKLGRLRYRSTGQQTVLAHCVETAHICGIMASEMGLNVRRAKRCGLLHDIGKAVDQETEGHHTAIGADICAKHEEHSDVVEAIRSHHADDISHASAYAVILHTANTLSARRPGARREVLETYVKRLDEMEKIINGFSGIDEAFVLQAGKEVRALVKPTGVSDDEVVVLSNDIASKIRHELTFPGQVKVTVIRESKFVDYAK